MSGLSAFWVGSNVAAAGGSLPDVGGWFLGPVGSVPAEPVLVALLAVGFVGMSIRSVFDSILSEDDGTDDAESAGDDGLMPEEGGDEFGDLGGLDDGDGDEFGEFGDDEFGDMDGGPDTDELEHRLDELETEVGSLSSTVNTVRNENEQISETVDDVEENVRKLLDIYEMVTRGVNPFADDIDAGGLGGAGDQSFGLFDDGEEETDDELESDIANADAEGFFDDDLVEEDGEDLEADADVGDVLGDEEEGDDLAFDDEFADGDDFDEGFDDGDDEFADEDDFGIDEDDAEDDGGEGGKSFAELKDEYESGDAEWAEGADGESIEDDAEDAADMDESLETETDDAGEPALEDTDTEPAMEDDLADDDLFDTVIDDEDADTEQADGDDPSETAVLEDAADGHEEVPTDDTDDEAATVDATGEAAETGTPSGTETDDVTETDTTDAESMDAGSGDEPADSAEDGEGKPYLTELPDGFLADLIVVEWLEFLVDEVGVRATSEAIHYYERIDWIDEEVADQLQAYLRGFDEGGDPATLTIDHHTESLRYVSQLDGGGSASIALDQIPAMAGGGSDGLQR